MLKRNKYLLLVIVILLCILQSCSVYRPLPSAKDSVYIEKMINLGGFNQAVIVRGESKQNPVLLHLHGGPGYPLFPYLDDFKELEKHFVMVYWEQRGTAKSLSRKLNDNSMATDTLLQDLNQLVNWINVNIDTNKIYIWGHSWGTNLGMLYVSQYPEKVKAYVGTGQSVNLLENERLCYEFAKQNAEKHQNKKAMRQVKSIDTSNYYLNDALKIRRWIYTFGGIVHSNYAEKSYRNFDIVKDIFKTPEYSSSDKWRLIFNSTYSGKLLWDDMMSINLFEQVKRVNCPVYFFEGRYDAIVSSKLAEKYFNFLEAQKGKYLIWFEESAHRPQTEEKQKFIQELLKVKQRCN